MSPPVPKLPGYNVEVPVALNDVPHYKAQTLTYLKAGLTHEKAFPVVQPANSEDENLGTPNDWPMRTSAKPLKLPQWLENDGKAVVVMAQGNTPCNCMAACYGHQLVLRYFAWFEEQVEDRREETWRIRKVVILYYLSDDTAQISEPPESNSGILQGSFVKRHAIPFQGRSLCFKDIAVGADITLYGRRFHVVDADAFTRSYCQSRGMALAPAAGYPSQPIEHFRAQQQRSPTLKLQPGELSITQYCEAMLGKPKQDHKLKQFIQNNKQVLCFHCSWQDPKLPPASPSKCNSPYVMSGAEIRRYKLHYFLEDDTVEVLEVYEANSGRDPFPALLRRSPLPKVDVSSSLTSVLPADAYYRPMDFRVGAYVRVYCRDMFIYDCDDFTRKWMQENLGHTASELQKLDGERPAGGLTRPPLPPHNGFGSEEDSLMNCLSLQPKPPKKDIFKYLQKDKLVWRFAARMVDSALYKLSNADRERRFVVSYFMADDTLSIFEPPVRNSGILGGRFLERSRVKTQGGQTYLSDKHLFAGAQIEVLHRMFELEEADEFTYRFMESNGARYPVADGHKAARDLQAAAADPGVGKALRQRLCEAVDVSQGGLNCQQLCRAVALAGLQGICKHQVVAFFREHQQDGQLPVSVAIKHLQL